MADETNKPLDADEISEDDLQSVAGGSTPLNAPEIKVIDSLPSEPAPTQSGKTSAGWDIAKNSVS
jgi:hypothetical protein